MCLFIIHHITLLILCFYFSQISNCSMGNPFRKTTIIPLPVLFYTPFFSNSWVFHFFTALLIVLDNSSWFEGYSIEQRLKHAFSNYSQSGLPSLLQAAIEAMDFENQLKDNTQIFCALVEVYLLVRISSLLSTTPSQIETNSHSLKYSDNGIKSPHMLMLNVRIMTFKQLQIPLMHI